MLVLKRVMLFLMVLVLVVVALVPAQTALAADYTVSCASGQTGLSSAMNSANNDGGASTINLEADCTYLLTASLPVIYDNGALTINGNGATIERSSANDVPQFSLIVNTSPQVTLNNLTLKGGNVNGQGGAIYNTYNMLLNDVIMTDNASTSHGAGLFNFNGATITLNSSLIVNNAAGGSAGGIFNSGTVNLNNTTISDNTASNSGGGVSNTSTGTVNIIGGTVSGNSTDIDRDGGGIYNNGNVNIIHTTFANNVAGGVGGAFYSNAGTVTIANSTITGNTASQGNGFFNNLESTVNITNTTIANNGTGVGVYNVGVVTLNNSIVANNSCVVDSGATISGSHNLLQSACTGGGTNTLTNTLLGNAALGTLTGSPAHFPLLNGSRAIDAGNNTAANNAGLLTDQIGNPRFYNDTGIADTGSGSAPIVDLGSVEKQTNSPLTISINDVTLTEGNSGTKAFNFTASLNTASAQTVTVAYTTANGSATAGSDYTAVNGMLTFNPGETSKPITVLVNGETMHEIHENFTVNLSNPTNATLADNVGAGQINNDDSKPTITVNNVSRTEGSSGVQTNLPFTVTLSNPSYQTITVQFATSDGTATTADADYAPLSLTTLSFAPGVTSRNVTVKINGDAKHEPHETVNFNLSNPTNATIADNLGVGTIANDDSKPTITVNDVSRPEGNSGTTNFPFVVTLSHPSYQTITVNFATSNGTATAGTDYTARTGSVSFAPGVTSRTVTVLGNADTLFEPNETFNFTLSSPVNTSIADSLGVGTITNDDAAGFSEEGVQIVPVAPELPQFLPVAPTMPDAPSVELPGVMLVSPMHATSENPVAFTWIGTMDAVQYRVLVQQQHDRASVVDITLSAGTCNGNICVFVSGFAPQAGISYVWTVTPITTSGAGQPSAEVGFSYSPSAPDGIELPGTIIGQ